MKIGIRKRSYKKSFSARTTGKMKRKVKSAINPLYGKKGMGWINDPKKAMYNKVYNKTTVDSRKVFGLAAGLDRSQYAYAAKMSRKMHSSEHVRTRTTTDKTPRKYRRTMRIQLAVGILFFLVAVSDMSAGSTDMTATLVMFLIGGCFLRWGIRRMKKLEEETEESIPVIDADTEEFDINASDMNSRNIKTETCPYCGAPNTYPEGSGACCSYCGNTIE